MGFWNHQYFLLVLEFCWGCDPGLSMRYTCEDVSCYYAHAKGMEGAAFMKELNAIVSNHRSLPYKEVLTRVEIYYLRPVSKSLAGKPEGWNREHLWPRSYGLTEGPSSTDLHNISPADVNGEFIKGK